MLELHVPTQLHNTPKPPAPPTLSLCVDKYSTARAPVQNSRIFTTTWRRCLSLSFALITVVPKLSHSSATAKTCELNRGPSKPLQNNETRPFHITFLQKKPPKIRRTPSRWHCQAGRTPASGQSAQKNSERGQQTFCYPKILSQSLAHKTSQFHRVSKLVIINQDHFISGKLHQKWRLLWT